jgi:hypothetical protein
MASASSGLVLDDSRVSGNATLFSGSTVKTTSYSRLQLKNGTRMDLGAGSKATIFENHASLESGMTEIKSGSGFELDANTVKVRLSQSAAVARVRMDGTNTVFVTALNATVDVLNRQGLLIARVTPGLPLSFMPQAGASSTSFDTTGCVLEKNGAAIVVDGKSNQVYELRGADLRKAVGNQTHVTGTTDATATPAAGASQVIKVMAAKVTKKGGCAAIAKTVGASAAAVGLGVAAGAGAAAAGGVVVAGAAIATTTLVVAGVAVAAAAGIGGAAAAGAIGTSSP